MKKKTFQIGETGPSLSRFFVYALYAPSEYSFSSHQFTYIREMLEICIFIIRSLDKNCKMINTIFGKRECERLREGGKVQHSIRVFEVYSFLFA